MPYDIAKYPQTLLWAVHQFKSHPQQPLYKPFLKKGQYIDIFYDSI